MISVREKYVIDKDGNTTSVILAKKDYDWLVEYIEDLEDVAAYSP